MVLVNGIQILALQLQRVDSNPGILPVKLGQAYKQEDKWTIVKVIDLASLNDALVLVSSKYNEFDSLINVNIPFENEFYNIKLLTRSLHDDTIEKFKQLVPSSRIKRGILNPLGSLIKLVTGNLDHEDAIRYDKLISQEQKVQLKTNKRLTIVSRTLECLINSTETLHNNTMILEERLKRIERIVTKVATKENNSMYSVYILNMFNLFITNFRGIYITISELETALALSKVSVLHQSIVNSTELLTILRGIEKHDRLIYPVSLSNLVNIEKTIVVKAYVKESQITFILEVPLTDNDIYNYYKLYSLPMFDPLTNLTSIIIPKYPYLLVKSSKYLPVANPCEEMSAHQFLCQEDAVVPYPEPTCIEQLMTFQTNLTVCLPHSVHAEDIKVQRIGPVDWMVYSRTNNILMEKCHDDVTRNQIQGTYILTINEDCELYLKETKLDRRRSSAANLLYRITPITSLPKLKRVNLIGTRKMDIKGINLDDLKHFATVLNSEKSFSENSESDVSIVKTDSISLATVILYIIIFIFIVSFLVWKLKFLRKIRNPHDSKSSDDFEFKEGGVMQPKPLRRVVFNA